MPRTLKRALLVGINYKGTSNELGGCINDVLATKKLLIEKYSYQEDNILLLTDDTVLKPTAANILRGWKWLLSSSPVRDFSRSRYTAFGSRDKPILFFHYSGHGSQVRDCNGDEEDGLDETICPVDFMTAGMISDDLIRSELAARVPLNGKLFALIDACHSESSFDLLWTVKVASNNSFSLNRVGNYLSTAGDVTMISGCQDFDTSADIVAEGKGQGALTYAFLSVLKAANYNITYDELLVNVRSFIQQNRISTQVPCLSFGRSVQISRTVSL